jgi:hypothetical protein
MLRLLVTANVPSLPILVTLMMEAMRSSETSVHKRARRYDIPEDGILHRLLFARPREQLFGSRFAVKQAPTSCRE